MNITEEEIMKLLESSGAQQWNATCDEIKKARGGQYPPDWFKEVILSGLAGKVAENWR
jgi:hypothetical protein